MNQPQNPIIPSGDPAANFAVRLPSQQWEALNWASDPQHPAWVWFKPPALPQGLAVRIPEETWRTSSHLQQLTVRRLLQTAGVDPSCVGMWQFGGMSFPGMNGANPLLDQPLPAPAPGGIPEITVVVNVPMMLPPMNYFPPMAHVPMASAPMHAAPTTAAGPMTGNHAEIFERLDIEWTAVLDLEKDLERLRKLLVDLSARMKILNRDLNSDERLYSSREDKQDWQDARRFLRDGENRLRACVKEFDIGDPSSAGYRRGLEHIYQTFVVPRVPFPGIESAVGQFEAHRKMVTTLQGKMNNAYLGAVQNGERRAQQVLARIAGKVREAGNKKTALGVVLDG
jgi:hypothetical protein